MPNFSGVFVNLSLPLSLGFAEQLLLQNCPSLCICYIVCFPSVVRDERKHLQKILGDHKLPDDVIDSLIHWKYH